jgi:hypothetical protein
MKDEIGEYEMLGRFYLGRGFDPETRNVGGGAVLYDSKDLVTHGVVLGMTGSGKTGLCMALLEEAAMDNIPAIVIDPKGDIANLMLAFPGLDAASFRPWINEDDAVRKGLDPEQHAAKTAELWKSGLEQWGQDAARVRAFTEKVDINIFTPGSRAGIPVSILSSLDVPCFDVMDDGELLGERIESTVSSLLSLVGVNGDPTQSPEAALLAAIFSSAWRGGHALTLESLIRNIQRPAFDKVGVIDLENFLPEKARQALALRFNNLLASPGFATWLEGPPLDIGQMLHTPDGKPRISIFSIAHLGDTERMFFVSLLLNQVLGWMRAQKGTTSLRALLYMDEIFGYLPPTANPPSKKPMLTLLKQARAFGLGTLLATQNPVDLDYKALSNIGTWWLGRLQTERDKARVLDGLEGAAAAQNAGFDRASMDKLLSGLGNRVFLMNNVHDDGPVLFHVRWVMSYLAGPLTRSQIKTLMDPKRAALEGNGSTPSGAVAAHPMAMPGAGGGGAAAASAARPAVGARVKEWFVEPVSRGDVIYQPHLLRAGTVHFTSTKARVDTTRTLRLVNPIHSSGIDWDHPVPMPQCALEAAPVPGAGFGELPGFAMNAANYKQVEKDFADWMHRNERADLFECPALKAWSGFDECEGEFRSRLALEAREARDAAIDKVRATASRKLATLETRVRTAQTRLTKEKAGVNAATLQASMGLMQGVLGNLFGRKGRGLTGMRTSTAVGRATTAFQRQQNVANVSAQLGDLTAEIAQLQAELAAEVQAIAAAYAPESLSLRSESIRPARTGVKVDEVALIWLPFDSAGNAAW